MKANFVVLLSLFVVGVFPAGASPRFARIFSDHIVLQRGGEIPVWGWDAEPGMRLKVRLGEIEEEATIHEDRRWSVSFPPRKASDEAVALILLKDDEEIAKVNDVLVGEVWLAAGQSNMQFPVKGMLKGLPEEQTWIDSSDCPRIRFRRIGDPVLDDRRTEARELVSGGEWISMDPQSVLGFSAVAAGFARKLHESLAVPVGMIDVSWGGKPIEPFIPREAFDTDFLKRIRELADREQLDELARTRGGVIIRNPEGHPGAIFNSRMAPIIPFGLRGFLWYQAESNSGKKEDPRDYRKKMESLIGGWRSRWANHEMPFYYVQLPSYEPATGWIRVREEQRRVLSIPNTGMAVTIDIPGEEIHPPEKLPVAGRLARVALAQSYHKTGVTASGPNYQLHTVDGAEVQVQFEPAGTELMVGNRTGDGRVEEIPATDLRWFELAGEDGVWHPAKARVDGEKVVVVSEFVAVPVEVRYACRTSPQGGNLYSRDGLPASPFCSRLDWLPWEDVPE
ncbi:MAG: sialate O-acetylesterase [Verrucomicrobiales bacterium]|nr:sialate O-acetylesterase [Verrucomicrobiales bacterium]